MATIFTTIKDVDGFQTDVDYFNQVADTAIEDSFYQFADSFNQIEYALAVGNFTVSYGSSTELTGVLYGGGGFNLQGSNLLNLGYQPVVLTSLSYSGVSPSCNLFIAGNVNASASAISGTLTNINYSSGGVSLELQGRLSATTGAGMLTSLQIHVTGVKNIDLIYRGAFRVTANGDISGNINYLYFSVGGEQFDASGLRANIANIDNLIDLSNAASILEYALRGNDTISGMGVGQTLYGYAGNDVLDPGLGGATTLVGGTGNDTYKLIAAATIVELAGEGTDKVESSVSHVLDANVENLLLNGTADIDGAGNELRNQITGNEGANVLDGAGEADILKGGKGDDTYAVDVVLSGTRALLQDRVTELLGEGTDTLVLRTAGDLGLAVPTALTLGANLENLDASGTGTNKLNLTGNALNNVITGNAGDNILNGGLGDDILVGGGGNDTLKSGGGSDGFTGGTGVDRFVIDRVTSLVAAISDFEAGVDALGLGQRSYGALFSSGVLKAGVFDNGAAATTATQRLFYDAGTGGLYYDSDGAGVAAAVQVATLTNTPASLSASDFVLALGS